MRSSMILTTGTLAILLILNLPSEAAPPPSGTSNRNPYTAFEVESLTNKALITKMFEGNFVDIDLDRTDNRFGILFQQYLEAFARNCSAALPINKVEMTKQRCVTERVTKNGFGMEINRKCIEYETVGTGLYAKPELYKALNIVKRQRTADMGRELSRAFGDVTSPDALSQMVGLIGDAQAIASDMNSLVQVNACANPGLLRFENNLRLFAINKQPMPIIEGKRHVTTSPSSKHQNYRKLVEDLILDDTKRWGAFAQFVPNSVTNTTVAERDRQGHPVRVVAPYMWDSMLGRKTGQVTLTFSNGLPECLTYSETSSVCHSPNRRIIARYLEGGYGQ